MSRIKIPIETIDEDDLQFFKDYLLKRHLYGQAKKLRDYEKFLNEIGRL